MITLQHTLITLLSLNGDEKKLKEQIPYVLLPDAIRKYTGLRVYSHFEENARGTDVSWMKLPENLKDITAETINKQQFYLAEGIFPAALGEKSHIEVFENHNKHLPQDYFKGVKKHITQDIIFDNFIREIIDCTKKYEDKYSYNGKEFNGKEIREWLSEMETHGFYILAYILKEKFGIKANQKWFDENVKAQLDKFYPEELSNATYKYMTIPDKINERIENEDWTYLNEGEVPLSKYKDMYLNVVREMYKIEKDNSIREYEEER